MFPRAIRKDPALQATYQELMTTMQRHGLVQPNVRPMTARNLLCFLHRMCGTDLGRERPPWTLARALQRARPGPSGDPERPLPAAGTELSHHPGGPLPRPLDQ